MSFSEQTQSTVYTFLAYFGQYCIFLVSAARNILARFLSRFGHRDIFDKRYLIVGATLSTWHPRIIKYIIPTNPGSKSLSLTML